MGFTSIWHWIIVLLIVLLLFGAGKLPKVMGDLAKGIKNFKAGLRDGDEDEEKPAATATPLQVHPAPTPVQPVPAATVQPATVQPATVQPAPGAAPTVTPAADPGAKKDEAART